MDGTINFDGHGAQVLSDVEFSEAAEAFILAAGAEREFSCKVSYPFQAVGPGAEEAYVEVLCHADHSESDVKSVVFMGKTVGWLCTVGALSSSEHDYAECKYYRRAAYAAAQALLLRGGYKYKHPVMNNQQFNLSDFFDDGLSVLILHRPSVGNQLGVDYQRVLPCLHKYGFVPVGAANDSFRLTGAPAESFGAIGKSLKIEIPSSDVGFAEFIDQMFGRLLPSANTPLLSFFLYYQLIEMMMANVFSHRQARTIEEMQVVRDDPFKVRPLFDRLKEDMAEKKRIKLLFGEYTGISRISGDLLLYCNDFLRHCEVKTERSAEDALYQVRNAVFHGMRGVPARAFDSLNEVVGQLATIVPQLLIAFANPKPDEVAA